MSEAYRDGNFVTTLLGTSSSDGVTPINVYVDPVTHRLLVDIDGGSGTVTSVSFTGGIISVATATTTPAFTVAGTSGGIPYFSSASTWATSAALAANAIVIGGGAGAAPATTTTGTGVLTALGINVGSAGAFVTFNGALGTPSSGTVTNLTGTASININGTVGATTPAAGAFTTLSATGSMTAGAASEFRAIRRQYEAFGTVGSPAQELGFTYGDITTNTNLAGIWFDNSFADNAASGLSIKASNAAGTVATVGKFSSTGLAVTGALSATGGVTLSGGTANGVAYLDGSKVLTTGSALTFDGTTLTAARYQSTSSNAALPAYGVEAGSGIFNAGASAVGFSVGSSEQMRLTSTGLGIGTSSPTAKLTVDTSGTSGYWERFYNSGTELAYFYFDATTLQLSSKSATRSLTFLTNDTERMRLDSSGNLGLGVTPSAWASGIKALQVGSLSALWQTSTYSIFSNNVYQDSGGNKYLANGLAAEYAINAGSHAWYTAPSGTAGNTITFTEAMTLNASGSLGLGNTSPSYTLDVTGTGRFTKTVSFTEIDNGNSSTADTIDWTQGNKQKSTLTGNCTYTFTAPGSPTSLVFKLVQDATGSRTVTWPAAVKWSGGTAPTLTTTANKVDIITFYYDGTTYFGNATLNFTA